MCLAWSLKFPLMVNCMNSQISELKQIIHLNERLDSNWTKIEEFLYFSIICTIPDTII